VLYSSSEAIRIATENARRQGARCRFIVADLIGDLHEVQEHFDFAFDWEFLHHVFPEDRENYVRNVAGILNRGAPYLSVSFSETDPQFGGTGKFRTTPIGTTLYFSSESEIRDLFFSLFSHPRTENHRSQRQVWPSSSRVCALRTTLKRSFGFGETGRNGNGSYPSMKNWDGALASATGF